MIEVGSRTKLSAFPSSNAEILHVVSRNPTWTAYRGEWFSRFFSDVTGIPSDYIQAVNNETVAEYIKCNPGVKLVLLNAFLFPVEKHIALARRYPSVTFTVLNHSSLPYTSYDMPNHFAMITASREVKNLRYALIDDRVPLEHNRMVYLSNAVRISSEYPVRLFGDTVRILISHRADHVKNLPTQLTAVGLLAKETKKKINLIVQTNRDKFPDAPRQYLEDKGIVFDFVPWVPWEKYPEFLQSSCDIALHCSTTESYNLAALEAMLAGCPVIGSRAVRYLPHFWQANHEDPYMICNRLQNVVERLPEYSRTAYEYGLKEAIRIDTMAADSLEKLYREVTQ